MWKNKFSLQVTTKPPECLKSLMVYILQKIYSKGNYISESIMGWLENQCSDGFGGEEQSRTDRGIWWRNRTTQACVAHSPEIKKNYIYNFWCIIGINENTSLQVCCIKWNVFWSKKKKKNLWRWKWWERERNKERRWEGDTLSSCYKPFNYHGKVERQILLSVYNKEK